MFHYRNHGADRGRVLAGIQVPEIDRARFRQRLDELEYPGGFKFRSEHHLCSGSRRGGCRGNDGS